MRRRLIVHVVVLLFAIAVPCAANTFSWDYQRTAFQSTSSNHPQTAMSMRNNQTWPIVYGVDQGRLNAYSLFPVPYAGFVPIGQPTNWHPIGQDLTNEFLPSGDLFLQADSGKIDGFGVAVQTPHSSSPYDATVAGTYGGGFQAPTADSFAIKFDENDAPFIGTNATIPNLPSFQKLFDVALSDIGDVGAITQPQGGGGPLLYWQKSPLLGGAWLSEEVGSMSSNEAIYAATADLTFDNASRPHIVGVNKYFSSDASVIAHRFDIVSGSWKSSTLDVSSFNGERIVDVAAAANDDGIVGAAWVNNGVLKYAFMDTTEAFPQWIITTVTTATPTGQPLEESQGVGLAFDNAGLPVISFVERFNRQIWVAYDPPIPTQGDFNNDTFVDGEDLAEWEAAMTDPHHFEADADGDGDSDGNDFLVWQRSLTPSPPASAAVPEPASLTGALLAIGLMWLPLRRGKRRVAPLTP